MTGERCSDCQGVPAVGTHCVGHLTEQEVEVYAGRLAAGEPLDGRKATIGEASLERLLAALDRIGVKRIGPLDFEAATFSEGMTFSGFELAGRTNFLRANFKGFASFVKSTFTGTADFDLANFAAGASFAQAKFHEKASFAFAEFGDHTRFDLAEFLDQACFIRASFEGPCSLEGVAFSGTADFTAATFKDAFRPLGATFFADGRLIAATFDEGVELDQLVCGGTLSFDEAVFGSWIRLAAAARALSCRSTRFEGSAELDVRWADIDLNDANFEQRTRIFSSGPPVDADELPAQGERAAEDWRSRLTSLRGALVRDVSLSDLDLRPCRFHGAHGLDEIRIEPTCEFAISPPGWRYTRRLTLAEEHQMRAAEDRSGPWYPPECQAPEEPEPAETLIPVPAEIVGTYRALRKALEDRGDIPGAGDFYYGEMEMRRLSSTVADGSSTPGPRPSLGEKAIVSLYWVVSGYGLRASRALACLLAVVVLASVVLHQSGFEHSQSLGRSLSFAIETSVSLLRPPTLELTSAGEAVQAALRLLGPLFLGLALLALRGRVKR